MIPTTLNRLFAAPVPAQKVLFSGPGRPVREVPGVDPAREDLGLGVREVPVREVDLHEVIPLAKGGGHGVMLFLLRRGLHPDRVGEALRLAGRSPGSETPLEGAIRVGDERMVKLLLAFGAEVRPAHLELARRLGRWGLVEVLEKAVAVKA